MILVVTIFILLQTAAGVFAVSVPECCVNKLVGGIQYTLVQVVSTGNLCQSPCVYQRDDTPGPRFCFSPGHLPVFCVQGQDPKQSTHYINTTWNGHPVRHNPVKVQLSSTPSGNLAIEIHAPLLGGLDFPPYCQAGKAYQAVPQLWNYEVVEIFFLDNPESAHYLELEFSPCGAYLAYLLHPVRRDLVRNLELKFNATLVVNEARWEGHAEVNSVFLPANVSYFNAFAIHKGAYFPGQIDERSQQWTDQKIYEALYPVTEENAYPGTLAPNFHNLTVFQPINLTELGVNVSTQFSDVWNDALNHPVGSCPCGENC